MTEPMSVYEQVGGDDFFADLVAGFYAEVAGDPIMRPMYPEDLDESIGHLTRFLIQYWGGPTTYSDERGHPRLRMRHAPFAIGPAARDAWFRHMVGSLNRVVASRGVSIEVEATMRGYFEMSAEAMRNHD